MKINTPRKSHKKFLLITSAVALVILLSYGAYAATSHRWPFASGSSNPTNPSDSTTTSSDPSTTVPVQPQQTTDSDTTAPASPKTPDNIDSPTKPSADQLNVTITSIMNEGDSIRIRSLIEAVTNNGTCTLTFTKDGLVVTKTSDIQALPSSSTCKGFTVPHSELPNGTWKVALTVTSDGKTGSDTTNFEVK